MGVYCSYMCGWVVVELLVGMGGLVDLLVYDVSQSLS